MPRNGRSCWNNLKKFWQCSVQTSNWCHKVELFLLTEPEWLVDQLWGHGNWRKKATAESDWKGQSIAEIWQYLQPNNSQSPSSSPPQYTRKTYKSYVLPMYISSQMFIIYRCMYIKYVTSTIGSPDTNLFICFSIKTVGKDWANSVYFQKSHKVSQAHFLSCWSDSFKLLVNSEIFNVSWRPACHYKPLLLEVP